MVEFIIGQAGSGKTTMMFEKIRKNAGNVCIIVPEQYSYEFDKTLYFYLGADVFNELFSSTFTGLSRQLFQFYGEPGRSGEYADELAQMIMIYQAVNSVRNMPGVMTYFRTRSTQNGFAEEVLNLINDMKRSGIEPEQLAIKIPAADKRLSDKILDISMIYLEYERLMKEYGFKNSLDNIKLGAAIAAANGWFKGKSVYIDEFESFTGDQLAMLRVILEHSDNVTIVLRTDDINAGEFTLFETVNRTFRRIAGICADLGKEYRVTACSESRRFKNPELEYLSSRILRNLENDSENAPEPHNIRIFESRDMYGEAEFVCASIRRLINSDRTLKYRDIAVISNDISAYTGVLEGAFRRYDIPYFLSVERPVNHTAVMVFFTSLLSLLISAKMCSEHIFRMMKSGIMDLSLTDVSLLENYCYKWSIDGDTWCSPFTADDVNLEKLEGIRSDFITPVISLKRKLGRKLTAEKAAALLYEYLINCGAERNTGRLMGKLIRENLDFEASELKRLWGCLIDILDSISSTLGEKEIRFSDLVKIIRSMVGRIKYSVPPQTLDAVIAASSRTARLNAPKVVFAIGSNDGDFPNFVNIHGLFSESDKMKLAKNGIEISRPLSDLIASERLVVYKALSAASEKLYITYPLSDLSGQAKYPSQVIDSVIAMFGDDKMRLTVRDTPPHFYAVTMHSTFYHYMQNRDPGSTESASLNHVLCSDDSYKSRISYVLSRSSYKQDFTIDSSIMQKLKSFDPLVISPSSLDEFNQCHFRYFCDKCLRLFTNEKMEFDARAAGDLFHICFKSILASRSKDSFLKLSYDDFAREISICADKFREERLAGDFVKDPRSDMIFKKITERMTNVFLHTQQSLMASDFIPHSYELDLRNQHSVSINFGEKYRLEFGGVVDRADICEIDGEKYVRIVDYKSSRKNITPVTLGSGINLQMLMYLFSATDKGGEYEDCQPAGVLYSPVQLQDFSPESCKINSFNSEMLNSSLKTSGLVLSDMKVLDAMEKGVEGNYIPVKMKKSGELYADSSCISREAMERLRDFSYRKLKEMAEMLLAGNAEAVPLVYGGTVPCTYCNYVNICDNSKLERFREPDPDSVAEAAEIMEVKK